MLQALFERPDQTVSDVARGVNVPAPVTSQYLRALNARGLLQARRTGRYVRYRPNADESVPEAKLLLEGVKSTFTEESDPLDAIFRLATAFTHPRRIEIVCALRASGLTFDGLREKTGISPQALKRHLRKLMARGFVVREKVIYRTAVPTALFAKRLWQVARVQ